MMDLSIEWLQRSGAGEGAGEREATAARLTMSLGGKVVTRHRSDRGDTSDVLTMPLCHLAEWISLNWWALLYEPAKSEDIRQDREFIQRHWMGTARKGFALPDLWIVPEGDRIQFSVHPAYLRFSRLQFLEASECALPRAVVEATLGSFVDSVVKQLRAYKGLRTNVVQYWDDVKRTHPGAVEFCRLMGALGLSPYEENREVEGILDRLEGTLESPILFDLCLAASPGNLKALGIAAETVMDQVSKATELSLDRLLDIAWPADNGGFPAWRWGVEAVKRARARLNIDDGDPNGADRFFEATGIQPEVPADLRNSQWEYQQLTAGYRKSDHSMKVALADETIERTRFSGARVPFLAMTNGREGARLLTNARTRDQQASRAFAAELLAPIRFIRTRVRDETLSAYAVDRLAKELGVSATVVSYQAKNNHIHVEQAWT